MNPESSNRPLLAGIRAFLTKKRTRTREPFFLEETSSDTGHLICDKNANVMIPRTTDPLFAPKGWEIL